MNNVVEIATIAFAFIFYASLIVKQHIAYRVRNAEGSRTDVTDRVRPIADI